MARNTYNALGYRYIYTYVTHAPAQFMCACALFLHTLYMCMCVYHYVCALLYSIDEGQNIYYSTCLELSDTSID